ncbi:PAS domain-containing protein, partial [archaeon]
TWLAALITAVEALPVCFTLASANSERQGFPLIYVNRYFERVTGYDRTALIGKACKDFLQCEQTEPGSVEVLREALKTASPACAILSNKGYDGRIFKNLVAIKPIFDENKRYKYVIGLHFDLSKEFDQGRGKMNLVKDLFAFIPESIVTDETALATPNNSAKS